MQTSQSELKSNTHNKSLLSAGKRAGVTVKEFIYLWIVQISELFVFVLLGCAFFSILPNQTLFDWEQLVLSWTSKNPNTVKVNRSKEISKKNQNLKIERMN